MFDAAKKQVEGSYSLSVLSLRVIVLSVFTLILIQSAFAQNVDLSGRWAGYNADGSKSTFVWTVTEKDNELTFLDVGAGTKTKFGGKIRGNRIIDSNNKTGIISTDGTKITWSDKVVWIRQKQPAKPGIPTGSADPKAVNLNGNWAGFNQDGTKSTFIWQINQNGSKLSFTDIGAGTGTKFSGQIQGNQITDSNGTTGTLGPQGNQIKWSDGVTWKRQAGKPNNPAATPGNPPTTDDIQSITRTITIKNNSGLTISGALVVRDDYSNANEGIEGSGTSAIGGSQSKSIDMGKTTTLGANISTPLNQTVELWIISEYGSFFRANLPQNKDITSLCYNVTGTAFAQNVTACDGGQTYETKYILVKNQAGYNTVANLSYSPMDGTAASSAATRTMTAGYEKKIYLPLNADTNKPMTLKLTMKYLGSTQDVLTRTVNLNSFDSSGATCYKAWGSSFSPKGDPCSTNGRKITFKNNGAYTAHMTVTYYDKDASGNDVPTTVSGNPLEVLESDSIEVPVTKSTKPITISIKNNWGGKEFFTASAAANFTGELCYKSEGTTFSPNASACDGTMGDTAGTTRQIRFQNDAGYDAKMVVTYYVDEMVNGSKVTTAKTVDTGFINGLGGKFRLVTIPKKTRAGYVITIQLVGSSTLKNDILTQTLAPDFAASPQPCFKTTGTLFNPSGGTCNQ